MTYSIIRVLILLMMRKLVRLIPATPLARFSILIKHPLAFPGAPNPPKKSYQLSKSTSMLYIPGTKENALWVTCAYTFVIMPLPSHCYEESRVKHKKLCFTLSQF